MLGREGQVEGEVLQDLGRHVGGEADGPGRLVGGREAPSGPGADALVGVGDRVGVEADAEGVVGGGPDDPAALIAPTPAGLGEGAGGPGDALVLGVGGERGGTEVVGGALDEAPDEGDGRGGGGAGVTDEGADGGGVSGDLLGGLVGCGLVAEFGTFAAGGSGKRIKWNSTLVRDSGTFRICRSRAPPRPASSTPAISTRRCSNGLRRW